MNDPVSCRRYDVFFGEHLDAISYRLPDALWANPVGADPILHAGNYPPLVVGEEEHL